MNDNFGAKSLCILGRQPGLGIAELERLYGAEHVCPISHAALLDLGHDQIDFQRLGGTIKLASVITSVPTTSWTDLKDCLGDIIPSRAANASEGKFTVGVSVYGIDVTIKALNQHLLMVKKVVQKNGRSTRIVPNKETALNSAQVLHNNLAGRGGVELLLVRNGNHTVIAQTTAIQDINAYAARDQARPKRDARIGMLPPKLAQIIVNLSGKQASSPRFVVLDPFCGTGVILQEALLMGFDVIGTDNNQRMVDYARANIDWLKHKQTDVTGSANISLGDAVNYKWPSFDCVASEIYLGEPLKYLPRAEELNKIINNVNDLLGRFLKNIASQLKSGSPLCLAVPAWRKPNGGIISLPLIDQISDMGYNLLDLKHVKNNNLIYFREDQIVARQLLVLNKK